MFTDIVGYTALMAKDERKAFDVLKQNLRIHEEAINQFNGRLIKELGDGILASFPTVSDALYAAIHIQKKCNETGEFKLSIGIHHGEVVVDKGDIFGDVVNVASRIRALGTAGAVLFSDKVADEIKNKTEFRAVPLGRFELKNVPTPVEVFALGNAGLPVPKRREIQEGIQRRHMALTFAAILLLVLGGYAALNYEKWLPTRTHGNEIVILPFDYMGSDSTEKYLSDAFYDALINRLERIVPVVSPESADQIKSLKLSANDIYKEFGVAYLLSGTFQRSGSQLRVTTRLSNTKTGRVMATQSVDRKMNMSSYFELQDEIALKVANEVGIVATQGLLSIPTTDNPDALRFFREALEIPGNTNEPSISGKHIQLLKKSILADSMFLEPWSALHGHSLFRYDNGGDSADLKEALRAQEKILKINPNSYIAKYAEIEYLYWVTKDYALVVTKSDELLREFPFARSVLYRKGTTHRRMGENQKFIDIFSSLLELNPYSINLKQEISNTLVNNCQPNVAKPLYLALKNTQLGRSYFCFEFNRLLLEGRIDELDSLAVDAQNNKALSQASRGDLIHAVQAMKGLYSGSGMKPWQGMDAYDSALFLWISGEPVRSKECFKRSSRLLQSRREDNPEQQRLLRLNYGVTQAGLGAPDWKKVFVDAYPGITPFRRAFYFNQYTIACLLAGLDDEALATLGRWREELTQLNLTAGYAEPFQLLLKTHPILDPIRNKPGFEELWEGNHLKVKPLKVPKALQIIAK